MLLVLLRKVRPVLAHRRGSVALEYAIVAPLLFAMVLGIIEYGFVFYGYSAVQTAANQTARDIAVNTAGISSAEATLNGKLPSWIGPSEVTVVQSSPTDLAKSNIVITAVTDAGDATPIKIFTSMLPMDLTTTVSVKTELPFDESVNPDDDDDDDDDD